MRVLRINKDASMLELFDKFLVNNENEIFIFHNWSTGRTYARARFEYDKRWKYHLYENWFVITKKDIKDKDAYNETLYKICDYYGYFKEDIIIRLI